MTPPPWLEVHEAESDAFESGWPMSALMGHNLLPSKAHLVRAGIARLSIGDRCVQLPYRVLPLGFTLNTLLAAGVLLGVAEGFAFARRRVRRAKGRCVACGYDRGGLAGDAAACPECGGGA